MIASTNAKHALLSPLVLLVLLVFIVVSLKVSRHQHAADTSGTAPTQSYEYGESSRPPAQQWDAYKSRRAATLRYHVENSTSGTEGHGKMPLVLRPVSKERQEALFKLVGFYKGPTLYMHPGISEYSVENVIEIYPFLVDSQGATNWMALGELRKLLNEYRQLIPKSPGQPMDQDAVQQAAERLNASARHHQFADIESPKTVKASDVLIEYSPNFKFLGFSDLQVSMNHLVNMQEKYENGQEAIAVRDLKNFSLFLSRGITLDEGQAAHLLQSRLEDLVKPIY